MENTLRRRALKLLWVGVLGAIPGHDIVARAADLHGSNAPVLIQSHVSQTFKPGDWPESDRVLPEVRYESLPITEVVANLKDKFPGEFDVVFPVAPTGEGVGDWGSTLIDLRLKNVKAVEIFNAMNLAFESGKTPLHWELTMNGHRPTALLRLLSQPGAPPAIDPTTGLPIPPPPVTPVLKPMVFFVGDLVGDPKAGRMTMPLLADTVMQICKLGIANQVSCYEPAQLLIIRGTEDEVQFVQSTLAALREKALLDAQRAFAKEHGQSEDSFWPEQWTKARREAQPGTSPNAAARLKSKATNAP